MTSEEYMKQVIRYRAAMAMAKDLLIRGIITKKDYGKIDTIMTKKYGIFSCTIFRE